MLEMNLVKVTCYIANKWGGFTYSYIAFTDQINPYGNSEISNYIVNEFGDECFINHCEIESIL